MARSAAILGCAAVAAAAAYLLSAPPAAAQSMCAIERADAYSRAREAQGLSGVVSADQVAEFERQCAGLAADGQRFIEGHDAIDRAARAGQNLFTIPEVRVLFTLLVPQGNSGASVPLPEGTHVSASDGRIALTRVCEDSQRDSLCRNHTTLMFDLVGGMVITCQRLYNFGEAPQVWWTFSQADMHQDPDGRWCPAEPADIPASVLEYWLGEVPAGVKK